MRLRLLELVVGSHSCKLVAVLQIVHWCVLIGCDYLKSLSKVGAVTAHSIVKDAVASRADQSLVRPNMNRFL
jgi:5'-3' exonuclease